MTAREQRPGAQAILGLLAALAIAAGLAILKCRNDEAPPPDPYAHLTFPRP